MADEFDANALADGAAGGRTAAARVPGDERNELSVIRRTYELILWYVPHLNRLPKTHKFGLGDLVVSNLYALLGGLVRARFAREKAAALQGLDGTAALLKYQTRLLRDFGVFDARRYEHASTMLRTIGREVGAWARSAAGTTEAASA